MRTLSPVLAPAGRYTPALFVLVGLGAVGLLAPWSWAPLPAIALVIGTILVLGARNALRRASRQIDTILSEELGPDTDTAEIVTDGKRPIS
ncbi:hypothetical protein [Actinophytocola sp.]|jgi:protein-S-isoprenylcysteine O-methyltransferase Ste14|uniref:hypothetical protein n=1 Tax=Actinophytocola sp. TaxID=1872138 RepID=UPI002ED7BADF